MTQEQGLDSIARALDAIRRERPTNLSERLSPIQRSLAARRDELRREQRNTGRTGSIQELNQLNQVLTLLHAVAYPGGSLDWGSLTGAQQLLQRINNP